MQHREWNPKTFFKKISPEVIAAYESKRGLKLARDANKPKADQNYHAWRALPEAERLALETRGRYYRASPTEIEVEEIAHALTTMDGREYRSVLRTRFEERFQIPLACGLLLLAIETTFGDRRRRSAAASRRRQTP